MTKKLWQASSYIIKKSNLYDFENYLSKKFKKKFNHNYKNLLVSWMQT